MVDGRTTEERDRDRKNAIKVAEQQRRDDERRRSSDLREIEASSRQMQAEAEKLKAQAVIKYSEALKLNEENKKDTLKLQTEVIKEEYQYQKARRTNLDNIGDRNWFEDQRHQRNMDIQNIRKDIAQMASEAQKIEAYESAQEMNDLLLALTKLEK
jgi:hypothetical protein